MGRVLYWIAVIPLFLVVIVFAVTNHDTAQLSLWPVPRLFFVFKRRSEKPRA